MNRTGDTKNGDSASESGVLIGRSIRWLRVRVQPVTVAGIGWHHSNAAFTIARIPARIAAGSPGHAATVAARQYR